MRMHAEETYKGKLIVIEGTQAEKDVAGVTVVESDIWVTVDGKPEHRVYGHSNAEIFQSVKNLIDDGELG